MSVFSEDSLPKETVSPQRWASHAFAAIRGENVEVMFDRPREPVWLHENDDENLSEVFPDF